VVFDRVYLSTEIGSGKSLASAFSLCNKSGPKKGKMIIERRRMKKEISTKERNIVPILGVCLDGDRMGGVLAVIGGWARVFGSQKRFVPGGGRFVVTPNPEFVVRATRNPLFFKTLNSSDLAIMDGVGLITAKRFLDLPVPSWARSTPLIHFVLFGQASLVVFSYFFNRPSLFENYRVVPGRLVFDRLIGLAVRHGWRVFLLGGEESVAQEAARRIKNKETGIKLEYASGPWLDEHGKPKTANDRETEKEVIRVINEFSPHLLFVGFGAPRQEFWLSRNLPKLKVGVGLGIGGAIDYKAGKVSLPPKMFEKAHLEWLWRLFTQPARAGRIFTAVVIFPLKVFLFKLRRYL
jgi:N-acetylglucosaminyldiphosphoundecaprenol N-acetyl-beta-D-mannosaminyltransferase